ncbi:MAG: hypothetical protein SGILL_003880 [Bacillariaceae sp.]
MDSHLTAESVLLSTDHDRLRRAERQIDKITLLEARRYGMPETQRNGRIKYTYAGHVFIFDPRTNQAVTSWKIDPNRPHGKNKENQGERQRKKKVKEPKSGTRFYRPILIQKSDQHDTAGLRLNHDDAASYVRSHHERWSSHTVIIVDCSGSMRDDDVDGARCRLDGVWTSLARDYVQLQLEKKTCSLFDVVSVIAMKQKATVLVECEPMSYILYNKLVSFRDWDVVKPQDHGFYMPAMKEAARLLSINPHGACSLSLIFFSDGKPSDHMKDTQEFSWRQHRRVSKDLVEMAGDIGSKFGRRLNFMCIGMAGQDEKFDTLRNMAEEAKLFGCQANFQRPNLESTALSKIMTSSVASSLATKTEMSSMKTGSSRLVRTDVERERSNAPDDHRVNEDWRVFQTSNKDQYVQNVWISRECRENAAQRRAGVLVGNLKNPGPQSYNVALKKKAFGEGAERLAFKFRHVGAKGKFIGPVLVAKESRFVEDLLSSTENYLTSHRHAYHKSFMRTQAEASKLAKKFNDAIDELDDIPYNEVVRIKFLKPYIFELEDSKNDKMINLLVEPMIFGKYKKFTDNFGQQSFVKRDFGEENKGVDLTVAAALLGREYNETAQATTVAPGPFAGGGLGMIAEGDSEEEDDEYSSDGEDGRYGVSSYTDTSNLRDEDYLLAFSHFTYVHSGGKYMVVDLQGALQTDAEGRKTYLLTDPAIHHRSHRTLGGTKSRQYGRTDLGRKGMRAFFETHRCNCLCKLFGFEEKTSTDDLDRLCRKDDS